MNNKRILKNEIINVKSNEQIFHPITSNWISTKKLNPICLTKFNLQTQKYIYNDYTCNKSINTNNYKNYLYIPPIGLSSEDLLKIYNINSIDELKNWITENIKEGNLITINRVFNCWIRVNYDTLKNYNNFLEKILSLIVSNFYQHLEKNNNLNKDIKYFIDYWVNKNSGDEYYLNLLDDFLVYMKKKYK